MQYSATQLAFGSLSFAFFPAAWILVTYMMLNKQWCFADFCVENQSGRQPLVRDTLAVFYSFLFFTGAVAYAAKKAPSLKRVLAIKVDPRHTVTLGEVAWFSTACLLSLIIIPAMMWTPYWNMFNMMLAAMAKGGKMNMAVWPWVRILYQTMILTTGDSLAILLGLVVLPVSKNSFLQTFFDLPYTSTLRTHMWLGYAIFWMIVYHLVISMLAYALDTVPLYERFFTVAAGQPWGKSKYFYLMGMISFFLFGIITITSLSYFRRKHYNFFYMTHFLVVAGIAFSYFHASMDIFYMIPGLCMYTVDGFIRLCSLRSKETVTNVVFEEVGYITVTIATTQAATAVPGQFMRVNVPSISTYEFHPWCIAKSTADSVSFVFQRSSTNEKEWSSLVADKLKTNPNIAVHLQGPFGKEIELVTDSAQNALLFYVAGTGIAGALAAIEQVLARNETVNVVAGATKIHLVWSARNAGMENLSWIQGYLKDNKNITLELFQTSDSELPSSTRVFGHRPNLRQILKKKISPLVSSDAGAVVNAGVFVCGPETFVRDALESAASYSSSQKGVKLTVEVESYDL
ncbi:UNVERIFIED_CONTAM: hypothetical protein HDU68_003471 [Siphonaria sp. JEL0065]|nr:hypothetical protein HDU68_003471 [Siphonaria sp. JEL0065]